MIGEVIDVTIDDIGSSGDGIGRFQGQPVYVPLTLPGDALTVRIGRKRGQGYAADMVEGEALTPRQQPVCRHFGACGGCRLQHLPPRDYQKWKCQRVVSALAKQRIDNVAIRPLIDAAPATRRRIRLAFSRKEQEVVLGFRRRRGSDIVAIEHCPIALPIIVDLLKSLRKCLATLDLANKGGEVSITSADNGLDLLIQTSLQPSLADREILASLAEAEDLARLAWRSGGQSPPEPIAVRRQPFIDAGGVPIPLPIGTFLQATRQAEQAIRVAVVGAIGAAQVIADLFAGCGVLSMPLAVEGRRVHAVERDAEMVAALGQAAAASGLQDKVSAEVRDLDREPLGGDELSPFDALIVDPPRAGGKAQVEAIATAANQAKIAMVSCNPATFARDARTLIDAGYRLAWVQPIDAFLYAAEIELVGAFERAKAS